MDTLLWLLLLIRLVQYWFPLIAGLLFSLVITGFLKDLAYLSPLEALFVFFVLTAFNTVTIKGLLSNWKPRNCPPGTPPQRG
jgi:hypothetical protein